MLLQRNYLTIWMPLLCEEDGAKLTDVHSVLAARRAVFMRAPIQVGLSTFAAQGVVKCSSRTCEVLGRVSICLVGPATVPPGPKRLPRLMCNRMSCFVFVTLFNQNYAEPICNVCFGKSRLRKVTTARSDLYAAPLLHTPIASIRLEEMWATQGEPGLCHYSF